MLTVWYDRFLAPRRSRPGIPEFWLLGLEAGQEGADAELELVVGRDAGQQRGEFDVVGELAGGKAAKNAQMRRTVGHVFQDFNLLAGLSAAKNVALPLELDGTPARKARAAGMRALEGSASASEHPLPGRAVRRQAPAGGDRQAVVGDRCLLLADECDAGGGDEDQQQHPGGDGQDSQAG